MTSSHETLKQKNSRFSLNKFLLNFLQVTDQNIDVWQNSPACVPDALRRYYYEYLSSTAEAAEVLNNFVYCD